MLNYLIGKELIVKKALLDAIGLYKGQQNLVNAVNEFKRLELGVSVLPREYRLTVSELNNYLNREDTIPYDDAIAIAYVTKISIKRLVPGNPMNNRTEMQYKNLNLLNIPVKSILKKNPECLKEIQEDRPVIMGTDNVVLAGQARVEAYQASGIEYISVECIDLEALYFKIKIFENIGRRFLNIELGVIGLRLEQLVRVNGWAPGPTFKGRKEDYIVQILGFGGRTTYRRIKKICLRGNSQLIQAVGGGHISIKVGAEIAELEASEQVIALQLKQKKVKSTAPSDKPVLTPVLKTMSVKQKEEDHARSIA